MTGESCGMGLSSFGKGHMVYYLPKETMKGRKAPDFLKDSSFHKWLLTHTHSRLFFVKTGVFYLLLLVEVQSMAVWTPSARI